jgi:signal transduction histidine kinase
MQAKLSSTAWESGDRSGQFVALRHVFRNMQLDDAGCDVHGPSAEVAGGVAEGAGLAHDAGNLLGALSLYSDLLALPGVLHEEYRAYAAELRLLSDRSWAMIHRLVNHVQVEHPLDATPQTTVLPEVVERCRGLLCKVAGQMVTVSYGAGAFEAVRVPAESVERILTNLVKNAAEATPWMGAISVRVDGIKDGARRRVVLTVRDKGCGMDPAAVRSLMQPGGISSSGGRGLGFRVVRELVAMSGGCLDIESQVDVGTSISAEWYALDHIEERGTTTVIQEGVRLTTC